MPAPRLALPDAGDDLVPQSIAAFVTQISTCAQSTRSASTTTEQNLKLGVLANDGSWYWNEISRAALERGHTVSRVEFATIGARSGLGRASRHGVVSRSADDAGIDSLAACDAIIVRTMPPGTLEQVVFRMDALATLANAGVCVVNSPKSIECAVDKYLTTARLEQHRLPVPATVTCQDSEAAMTAFDELGGDVVVKPLFGSEGRGIVRVSDPDLAFRTFRTLERTGCVLYLQKFIDHEGYDVRVLVLDGKVVGSMKRFGGDDFRTNIARTGKGEPHQATDVEQSFAIRAAQAVDCRIAGVDLLYDRSGVCYVIEVNAVPGWQAFNRVNNTDVASLLIASLESST